MAPSPWSKDTVAVVTGANRGIGLEIVRRLAQQGLTVVLAARDKAKGQAAVDGLVEKGVKSVVFHELQVSDPHSAESLASWLKAEYGGIDILVNNAGRGPAAFDYESAKQLLDTNYYGVKVVTKALLPLFKPSTEGARIVQVTSRAGVYERLRSESIKDIFRDEDSYTEDVADLLAEKYLDDVKASAGTAAGMCNWLLNDHSKIYSESKMFLNVYTSALAKSLEKSQPEGHEIFVASACPGPTRTDMFKSSSKEAKEHVTLIPVKTVEEGVDTAVWLAVLPKEEWQGKSGRFFAERKEYLFGWKNPPF